MVYEVVGGRRVWVRSGKLHWPFVILSARCWLEETRGRAAPCGSRAARQGPASQNRAVECAPSQVSPEQYWSVLKPTANFRKTVQATVSIFCSPRELALPRASRTAARTPTSRTAGLGALLGRV